MDCCCCLFSESFCETNVRFQESFSILHLMIFSPTTQVAEKGTKRAGIILNCYLKQRLRLSEVKSFFFFCAKSPSKDPRHAPVSNDFSHASISCRHKTPPRRSLRHKKKTLKNVSRLTPRDERREKNPFATKNLEDDWCFCLFFRLLLSSRLICLSRQTHQQLFFFGWSSIKHITQTHTHQRPGRSREIREISLETKIN